MVSQTQKKNAKSAKVETTPVIESTPAPTPVVEVAAAPVAPAKTAQKGGAKKAAAKAEAPVTPVVAAAAAPVAPPKTAQKGGAKKAVAKTETVAAPVTAAKKGGAKKAAAKTEVAAVVAPAVEGVEGDEVDGKSRSFKVKLPGEQEFSGRFTGLTPYQAANKALSKYFRTNENNNITSDQVIFSIKESTRGSKRHEYTYKGTRVKLEQPITYTIKSADGADRVITKQYKNQLTKVKKGNATVEAAAPVANA
jgi:hypothetical protein